MAQTNFTPILLYASGTPTNVPSAGNLTSSASGAELALNYADGKLFYKDSGGNVQTLASKATGSIGGSDTQVQYNSSGALAGSANLTFNGTTLTANSAAVSTGNLTFSGTAQRITGDMSNATIANRLAFQSSTTNGNTSVGVIPNGTSQTTSFRAFNSSDPNNASTTEVLAVALTDSRFAASITGTGTYLPMTFYTGGSERMRIDTSGNVGIGTASPTGPLSIRSGSSSHIVLDVTGTSDDWGIAVESSTKRFYINEPGAGERLSILQGGNVGIGTASPDQKLVVDGVIQAGTTGNNGTLYLGGLNVSLRSAYSSNILGIYTNNTEQMRIDSSGNVGIGTSSPGDRLDVVGGNIRIASGNTVRWVDAGNIRASIQGDSSSNAIFSTAGSERLRIDSSGNVGIGTSSPNALLHLYATTNPVLRLAGGADSGLYIDYVASFGGNITVKSNQPLVFKTNDAERARITAAGNIVAGASAALATTATDGFLYVPTCAGTPTGTPTAITGMAPIVVNTTNNKLYFYSGGTWRDAGP